MVRAGSYRDRVTFQQERKIPDGGGGHEVAWTDVAAVWGHFMPARGRERVEAGRIQQAGDDILRVRYHEAIKDVDGSYRASIDGVQRNIRSVIQVDRRNRVIEMVLERGVAV